MNMKNIAYSEEYKEVKNKFADIFSNKYFCGEHNEKFSDKYSRNIKCFDGSINGLNISASINTIIDRNGTAIYEYKSIDNSADFCTLILHSNCKEYIVFRCDLYGYSVLDLSNFEESHYFPECSLGGKEETFIWTQVNYNVINNIVTVSGCFWAAPYGVILVDFSDPMNGEIKQLDLRQMLDSDYSKYDDIDFDCWDNTDLHLLCFDCETEKKISIILSDKKYLPLLNADNRGLKSE